MSFSRAIALTESRPGHYAEQIAEGWDIEGNANGGYLLALAANGLRQHLGRPDPVSITAIITPWEGGAGGRARNREGRQTLCDGQATLEGPGGAVLSALGTFGNLEFGAAGPTQVRLEPPALPALEACRWARALRALPSLMDRIEARLHPEDAGFRNGDPEGIPEMRGYFRLPEEDPCSVLGLLLGLDAFPHHLQRQPPRGLDAHGGAHLSPAVLSCAGLAPGALPGVISSGFLEEDGELWDSTGQLVAQSRLALVPMAATP